MDPLYLWLSSYLASGWERIDLWSKVHGSPHSGSKRISKMSSKYLKKNKEFHDWTQSFFSDALNWWWWLFQNGLPLAMALPWVAVSVGSCWFVSLRPSFGGCQLSYDPNNLLNSFPWQKLKKIWKLVSYLDFWPWFCWLCGDGLGGVDMVELFVEYY